MSAAGALLGLFLSALLSATLLPGTSEAALAAVLALGEAPATAAIGAATLGNTLGSLVNWALGRQLARYGGRRWFPITRAQLDRASALYRRWGTGSLLLSWVPVIGDPLTFAAGVLGTPLPVFLALVAVAKLGRYLLVAGLVSLA